MLGGFSGPRCAVVPASSSRLEEKLPSLEEKAFSPRNASHLL